MPLPTDPQPSAPATPTKARRGFACMSPERRIELARLGGKAVPAHKRSFARDRGLAISAGTKGGQHSSSGSRPFTTDK